MLARLGASSCPGVPTPRGCGRTSLAPLLCPRSHETRGDAGLALARPIAGRRAPWALWTSCCPSRLRTTPQARVAVPVAAGAETSWQSSWGRRVGLGGGAARRSRLKRDGRPQRSEHAPATRPKIRPMCVLPDSARMSECGGLRSSGVVVKRCGEALWAGRATEHASLRYSRVGRARRGHVAHVCSHVAHHARASVS